MAEVNVQPDEPCCFNHLLHPASAQKKIFIESYLTFIEAIFSGPAGRLL